MALILGCVAGAIYTGTFRTIPRDFFKILTSPGPLVTDYFMIGSMPAAFLNAGLCGLMMSFMMFIMPGHSHVNTLAGFFLVIAHCFYGLNLLNMLPCFYAPFLYLRLKKLDFNQNLHVCMFATCFSPFVSELLFRYTQGDDFVAGAPTLKREAGSASRTRDTISTTAALHTESWAFCFSTSFIRQWAFRRRRD